MASFPASFAQRISRPFIETLESRIAPAVLVSSIERADPLQIQETSAAWVVSFTEAVSGVDASDFHVVAEGAARADQTVTVAATENPAVYTVTAHGIGGSGMLRLDLVDNDSIAGASGSLGGDGSGNGSFLGDAYQVRQIYPQLVSITAAGFAGETNPAWTVTFDEAVSGVDFADFRVVKGEGVHADARVVVVSTADPAIYTVIATNVTGQGTAALQFVDDGSVRDGDGNPLQTTAWSFAGPQAYSTGTFPQGIAVGDLNGDGHLDLVTANAVIGQNEQSVSVLLNRGDGTFDSQKQYGTGARPISVAIDDFNGDGRADLVTANYFDDTISVLLGVGDGTFAPQETLTVGDGPWSVLVADLNRDGRADIVTANASGDSVSVLLGNGNGTFQSQQFHATGNGPTSVRAGDFNADGWLDLATANFDGSSVSILLASGGGTFGPQRVVSTDDAPVHLALGDIDGDGVPELIAAHYGAKVSIILDPAAGGVSSVIAWPGGNFDLDPALADFDGDGVLDLAIADYDVDAVFLLRGAGDGSFRSPQPFASNVHPVALAVGDLNADGRPDLAVANFSTFASVLLHTGGTTLTSAPVVIDSPADDHRILVVAPGVPPSAKPGPTAVRVFAAGSLTELYAFHPYGPAYRGTVNVAVGDLTGDGIDDIATTTGAGTGRLRVFDGLTGERARIGPFAKEKALFNGTTDRGAFVAIGDLDGDGRNEVIAGTALRGGKVRVLDGETGRAVPVSPTGARMLLPFSSTFTGGVRVAAGDVNGDGLADVIAGQAFDGARVKVYASEPGASPRIGSAPIVNFKVGPTGYQGGVTLAVTDHDGDGAADLIVGRNLGPPSLVEIFDVTQRTAEGDPVLLTPPLTPFDGDRFRPSFPAGVRVGIADVNLDGLADIVAATGPGGGSQVRVFNGANLGEVLAEFVAFPNAPYLGVNVAGSAPKPPLLQM